MAGKPTSKLTDAKVRETVDLAQEMFENYEKKVLDLTNQLKFVRIINATLDLEQMVNAILFSCQGNILVSGVAIFLPEDLDMTAYTLNGCVGYEKEKFKIRIRTSSQLIKELKKAKDPIHFSSINSKDRFKRITSSLEVLKPELLIPLKVKENLNGFLIFGKKLSGKDFTNSEYNFMNFISEAAAIAMENAFLYMQATMDRMTGLFVNHYFKNRLLSEMLRAKRYKQHLSLIMVDIDHFKKVNDTYGHQLGDKVIKAIGGIIMDAIREIDIAARYGGEEFAIILPETDQESACTVCERLRATVENHDFKSRRGSLKITASFGVATLLSTDATPGMFIERADELLYHSKKTGRNRVTCQKSR